MKNSLAIFLLLSVYLISSCSKNNDDSICQISGNVIGYNRDKCGCCPGWLVTHGMDTLKFLTVPENEQLRDLVNFYGYPVPIRYDYKNDESSCSDSYKIMTFIEFKLELNCSKTGEIIDYDETECDCCPGWIIKTGNDTIKVLNLTIESQVRDIVETSGFPIHIKLDYEDISGSCEEFYKKLTCFQIID
jgi:hypothetical protein